MNASILSQNQIYMEHHDLSKSFADRSIAYDNQTPLKTKPVTFEIDTQTDIVGNAIDTMEIEL